MHGPSVRGAGATHLGCPPRPLRQHGADRLERKKKKKTTNDHNDNKNKNTNKNNDNNHRNKTKKTSNDTDNVDDYESLYSECAPPCVQIKRIHRCRCRPFHTDVAPSDGVGMDDRVRMDVSACAPAAIVEMERGRNSATMGRDGPEDRSAADSPDDRRSGLVSGTRASYNPKPPAASFQRNPQALQGPRRCLACDAWRQGGRVSSRTWPP